MFLFFNIYYIVLFGRPPQPYNVSIAFISAERQVDEGWAGMEHNRWEVKEAVVFSLH